ncbi:PKD repeat protein [Inhella inkyongensis]|uniref:PKD repeat protein n=1 Tax=Inhella inkyongensis TaxID=392593 RepID=A0A840RZZ2_9BURK|nr:PKD domain-containing protein [Inhella inkyongensis]MBB5204367.1 PKD repeat protein [Inhella inkyongensis]
MRRLLLALPTALVALLNLVSLPAQAADPANPAARRAHPGRAPFPQISLPEVAQGERAVALLGQRLPEVARWYGKSEEEFAALLRQDHRLRLDRRGRLFAVDTLEAPLPTLPADQRSVLDGNLLPLEQTFALHSRPGAKRTIYLNFKGATLTGTAWNSAGTSITALPYDLDGIPYSFNTTELQRIQGVWQRVAEDFAPFDVNVTTEAPPPEALSRAGSTDQVFGTTVLITNSNGVYSCSCGGVAYIGAFDDTSDFYKPALVFYNQLGGGNEKYVAEAASHEAGHNLGLQHDGYSGGGYYGGHGTGVTAWAPIMGVGYSKPLVQWSKGEYSTATNVQDDFAVAESYGLPIRLDDHGDLAGNATAMTGVSSGGSTSFSESGVIERSSDVDQFSFNAAAGALTVSLQPAVRAANLDAVLELRTAAGILLASSNPLDTLNASLSITLASPGTYFLSVRGTGKGDPLVDGYTAYGSVGHYALSVTAAAVSGSPPVAVATGTPTSGTVPLTVAFSAAGSSDADGSIVAYDWTFGDGGSASGAQVSHVYTAAGSYSAQLRVTDNSGLSATKSVAINVNPVVTLLPMGVADIAMGSSVSGNNRWRATAAVRVLDSQGRAVVGATVSARWSGLVSGNATATTGSNGVASFQSGTTRNSGSIALTVTGINLTGYQCDSTRNVETSDSISR